MPNQTYLLRPPNVFGTTAELHQYLEWLSQFPKQDAPEVQMAKHEARQELARRRSRLS